MGWIGLMLPVGWESHSVPCTSGACGAVDGVHFVGSASLFVLKVPVWLVSGGGFNLRRTDGLYPFLFLLPCMATAGLLWG